MFDFSTITQWVDELLRSFLPHAAATLVEFILIGRGIRRDRPRADLRGT